ncbi:lycopene cyclase domain-containing protein [Halegenticoccus tardaugens]|uniref:lycopene cyclase domain-containing protein n=1 Tax=Halegenticoccus tardaugens TaxID=2071624 RepID=UPI00100C3214|nr:lycopene cyclase domain-containing protein [Halegenticoccus tardaugens]
MITSLTYFEFLALFVLPPTLALFALRPPSIVRSAGRVRVGIALLAAIGLVYTTPWDNYLVSKGVWSYGSGTVTGRVWHAPVEEYVFIVLQSALTGLWTARIREARGRSFASDPELSIPFPRRVVGVLAGASMGAVGAFLLRGDPTFYLGSILLWAAPVFALQWGFGWPYLFRHRRTVALGVLAPTAYLCLADRFAIGLGIWRLSPRYTTGVSIAGLPVEEAAFFLATNAFIVQGLLLFLWVVDRWR